MDLKKLGVQEMDAQELNNTEGGNWLRAIAKFAAAIAGYVEYCEAADCAGNYDNNEDVGGMGFPTCA